MPVVPASVACSWLSSSLATSISNRLRPSTLWMRLVVTGLNSGTRDGSWCDCMQRCHDWITASLTMPDGRTPSSK